MKKGKLVLSFIFSVALVTSLIACNATKSSAYAYVTYDINPSIGLVVNQNEKVVAVEALNDDAEILLADITVVGLSLEAATDLIIQTSIELGFIDVNEENIIIETHVEGNDEALKERIRTNVMKGVNQSFEKRAMVGRANERSYGAEMILDAQALGVSVEMYVLVNHALRLNDELTLEAALELSVEELRAMVIEMTLNGRNVAAQIREEFLTAKDALKAEFQPLIADLEAQIEAAITAEEDTAELTLQLEALQAEFKAELTLIRDAFLTQSQALRAQLRIEHSNRKAAHAEAMVQFRLEMEARRESLQDAINKFQGRP